MAAGLLDGVKRVISAVVVHFLWCRGATPPDSRCEIAVDALGLTGRCVALPRAGPRLPGPSTLPGTLPMPPTRTSDAVGTGPFPEVGEFLRAMARVSLILPTTADRPSPEDMIPTYRSALERAGHDVEIVVATGPSGPLPAGDGWHAVRAAVSGPAAAAVAGLEWSRGEFLIVLDPDMGYDPADLSRILAPLLDGGAELVVASRLAPGGKPGRLRRVAGTFLQKATGTSDPMTGLMALTRPALERAGESFDAVGMKFSLEILAKLGRSGRRRGRPRARSRWLDLPVRRGHARHIDWPGWDDVRHLKRLADHRYGNLSRLVQFCVVGASAAIVDLSSYALFQWVFAQTPLAGLTVPRPIGGPMSLAAAGVVAVSLAVVWNFTLNRRLTFNDARRGSILKQFFTYALSNAVSVPLSLFLRLKLPQTVPFFRPAPPGGGGRRDHRRHGDQLQYVPLAGLPSSFHSGLVPSSRLRGRLLRRLPLRRRGRGSPRLGRPPRPDPLMSGVARHAPSDSGRRRNDSRAHGPWDEPSEPAAVPLARPLQSANSTRPRPPCLARTSAASARARIASGVSPAWRDATPALAPESGPSASARSRIKRSASFRLSSSLRSGQTSRNSSPPNRAARPPGPACAPMTPAANRRSRSPSRCPRVSLTVLNRSRSSITQASGFPDPAARATSRRSHRSP